MTAYLLTWPQLLAILASEAPAGSPLNPAPSEAHTKACCDTAAPQTRTPTRAEDEAMLLATLSDIESIIEANNRNVKTVTHLRQEIEERDKTLIYLHDEKNKLINRLACK